jgi:uncharacterized protein DUF2798
MQKIPRKYSGFVMGAVMAVTMGFIMSFVVTFLNLGFVEDFPKRWMFAFLGTLPIGFPVAMIVTPIVKACIDRISE